MSAARSPHALALGLVASSWATPPKVAGTARALLDAGLPATADRVLRALDERQRQEGAAPSPAALARCEQRLEALGAQLRVIGDAAYPAALADAWPELGAPAWLLVRAPGRVLPAAPAVAVVGTRHPTLDGLRTARELAAALARAGVTVVSGMARGIDQAAHRGALDAGGATVAVLGTGFDVDYPRGDAPLRQEIAASGGLVTELAPDAGPNPRHFLWRNRVVSGLAAITVVVEGRARSGALQTARLAAGQGRDVWAVPGSLHAPTSRAPLDLIRDGAQVVTRIDDVLEALGSLISTDPREPDQGSGGHDLPEAAARILSLLGAVPETPGALAAASGLPVPAVLAAVAELSARSLAVSTPRGVVAAGTPAHQTGTTG